MRQASGCAQFQGPEPKQWLLGWGFEHGPGPGQGLKEEAKLSAQHGTVQP